MEIKQKELKTKRVQGIVGFVKS